MQDELSNDLAVKLTLASQFPDQEFRERLWRSLDEWCESLEPSFSVNEVRSVLSANSGTVLEPFALSESDLRISCLVVRACLSKRLRCGRVRVVSRKSFGSVGGLVLTAKLNSYYAEQFAFGKRSGKNVEPYVAPAKVPKIFGIKVRAQERMSARLICDDSIFALDVYAPLAFGLGSDFGSTAGDIEIHSTMGGMSLRELGLTVRAVNGRGWQIVAKTAEAQIRMSAHLTDASVVRLSAGPYAEFDYNLAFRLSPDVGTAKLCVAVVTPKFGLEFLPAMPVEGPRLSDDDIAKVLLHGLAQEGWLRHLAAGVTL